MSTVGRDEAQLSDEVDHGCRQLVEMKQLRSARECQVKGEQ